MGLTLLCGASKIGKSWMSLQLAVAVSSGEYSPVRVKESPYGMRHEYEIPIKGPNGQTKKVLAVFQLSPGSTKPVLITNYLLGKEKQ